MENFDPTFFSEYFISPIFKNPLCQCKRNQLSPRSLREEKEHQLPYLWVWERLWRVGTSEWLWYACEYAVQEDHAKRIHTIKEGTFKEEKKNKKSLWVRLRGHMDQWWVSDHYEEKHLRQVRELSMPQSRNQLILQFWIIQVKSSTNIITVKKKNKWNLNGCPILRINEEKNQGKHLHHSQQNERINLNR